MSGLAKTKSEINTYFDSAAFVEQTCAQINKDLIGIADATLKADQDADLILNHLIFKVTEIINSIQNSEKLAQFIYKVDLPEHEFKQTLATADWNTLSFLIIRREAQKVYLRNKFKTI